MTAPTMETMLPTVRKALDLIPVSTNIRQCAVCGVPVRIRPSRIGKQHRYHCSRRCSNVSAKLFTGANTSRWDGGPESRQCICCGSDFIAQRRELNRRPGLVNFCSRRCLGIAKRQSRLLACLFCRAEIKASAHQLTRKYCSVPCKNAARRKSRTAEWHLMRRLNDSMSSMMYVALKAMKAGKQWETLAGYGVRDLMAHLESKFLPSMTWENMGEWHIDHIRPRASFTFSCPEDSSFRECWALSNLQPLWALDNLKKGARLVS